MKKEKTTFEAMYFVNIIKSFEKKGIGSKFLINDALTVGVVIFFSP